MTLSRQRGAVLLMVSMLLATIAALAFGMNRAASVEARSVRVDYERRAASYLAEAAVANAKWINQVSGCTTQPVPDTPLGAGRFSASVPWQNKSAKMIDIAATGAVNGSTVQTLQRNKVALLNLSQIDSIKLTNNAMDATIDYARQDDDDDDDAPLSLVFQKSHALLYWAMSDIRGGSRILYATLTLTPYGSNGTGGAVAVHRLTTRWDDDDVSWSRPDDDAARWNGGDYVEQASATAGVAGYAAAEWNVTDLVAGWYSNQLPNHGMLLRLTGPAPTVRFHNGEASSSRRPTLLVVSARPC